VFVTGGEVIGAARALLLAAVAVLALAGCALLPPAPPDPLSAEEHNELGVAYYRRGEYEAAAREFRAATSRRPGFTRALVNLGDAQLALGAVEAAIDAYEHARATSPDDPGVANNLAWALLHHERRWPEAEPVIRDALSHDPVPRGYYLDTLGLLLLRKDQPREALVAFRAALADDALRDREVRGLVLRHLGDTLARLGDRDAAERCYRLAGGLPGATVAEIGGSDPMC
jgi:tetratricopeptide (TPR) repeat protein